MGYMQGKRAGWLFACSLLLIATCSVDAFAPSPALLQRRSGCLGCISAKRRGGGAPVALFSMLEKTVKDHKNSKEFSIGVLGDLHLDDQDMDLHHVGRDQMADKLKGAVNPHLVSLGDLGAYGGAGTTKNFLHTKEYLSSFKTSFDLVTGNHDLEGMDEFETDEENLAAFLKVFEKKAPQFCTEVADKTLCVGLSTVRFRSAQWSSHEVYVDSQQIKWFESVLEAHPASEGWNVIVFTHAPIMGCNLRALQDVHIKNGCAWINHTDEKTRAIFIELCEKHPCIKAWFSGHFHLSHDYKEAITTGGSGQAFCQVGVIGEKSQRDGRRQSRLVRGDEKGLKIFTVNHHLGGTERLDMEIVYAPNGGEPSFVVPEDHEDWIKPGKDKWFSARVPEADDGCFLENFYDENPDAEIVSVSDQSHMGKVCWWHMADGKVLGLHDGLLVEYDAKTLAPLGIVVKRDELDGKDIVLADGGKVAMLYWECDDEEDGVATKVIHPNDDGSYYRRYQRNKAVRTQEKMRESLAKQLAKKLKK